MERICVVGTTGAGKTTFARRLSERLGCRHIELDAHYWGPDWTQRSTEEFRASVVEATACESWVADGNYHKVRDLLWARADNIVWLDYSIGTVLTRLTFRTARRVATREQLWNGNRERGWAHLTQDSLFIWALRTHWRRRRTFRGLTASPEFAHLQVKRFLSPGEAEAWLSELSRLSTPCRPTCLFRRSGRSEAAFGPVTLR